VIANSACLLLNKPLELPADMEATGTVSADAKQLILCLAKTVPIDVEADRPIWKQLAVCLLLMRKQLTRCLLISGELALRLGDNVYAEVLD
jgi:hypothetical protein